MPTKLIQGAPLRQTRPVLHAYSRACEWGFAGAIVIYCLGYLAWYSTTALGRYPVLDEREVLNLARLIATGELPAEAFYRAPLFSGLLALPLWLGSDPADLPLLARALNFGLHLTSTFLVWRIAGVLWCGARAAQYTAATLIGFNPLLLHFCGDALDITCAITCMLLGLKALLEACHGAKCNFAAWTRSSAWFGLSALARPQMLALSCVLPLLAVFFAASRTRLWSAVGAAGPACLLFISFGLVNYYLADDFRVLPWQGAYNFWSANRPGAHGLYFEQTIPIYTVDESANTARLESEILYRRAAPAAPADYQAQTNYWRTRGWQAVAADPVRWVALIARKAGYLLNNVEQYNNKTYSFHKARSPWLRWNPLSWSLLLGLGVWGGAGAFRRRGIQALTICALAYAAGVLLYYVSDRFRAPLVVFTALAAGGVWYTPSKLRHRVPALLLAISVTALSLLPIPVAERTRTYVQDYLALARAHSQLGEHRAARVAAEHALALAPQRLAALSLACVSRFNWWLHEPAAQLPASMLVEWAETCRRAATYSPAAMRLLGFWEWRSGHRGAARQRWAKLAAQNSEERIQALAWLALTGELREQDIEIVKKEGTQPGGAPLMLALAYRGDREALRALTAHWPSARVARELTSLRRLFGPSALAPRARSPGPRSVLPNDQYPRRSAQGLEPVQP